MATQTIMEKTTAATSLLLLLVLIAVAAGFANRSQFDYQRPQHASETVTMIDPKLDPKGHAQQLRLHQLEDYFQKAVAMLHAKQYEFAIAALHKVIELSPKMPEAYVNMGYALIGLENYSAARDFFQTAIELKPYQANAYWGLAVSLEQLQDYEGALGAMRSFIHLSPPNDPYLRQARSALWEWESQLKRGPLPEAEQEWIERRSKEWVERSGPEADRPEAQDRSINLPAAP